MKISFGMLLRGENRGENIIRLQMHMTELYMTAKYMYLNLLITKDSDCLFSYYSAISGKLEKICSGTINNCIIAIFQEVFLYRTLAQ